MRYLIKLNTAEIGQLGELLSFNPVEVIQYRSTSHIIMCTNGNLCMIIRSYLLLLIW